MTISTSIHAYSVLLLQLVWSSHSNAAPVERYYSSRTDVHFFGHDVSCLIDVHMLQRFKSQRVDEEREDARSRNVQSGSGPGSGELVRSDEPKHGNRAAAALS